MSKKFNLTKGILLVSASVLLMFFSLCFASAENYVGGDCDTIQFPNSDSVELEVSGNSSQVDIDWSKNGTEITFCFPIDLDADNFTLTWFNYQSVSVGSSSSSGGGSSGSGSSRVSQEQVYAGYQKILSKNQKIFFSLEDNNHFIQLTDINSDSAEFLIKSEERRFSLQPKYCELVKLEEDLALCLIEISDNKVTILFKAIEGGVIPANETEENETEIPEYTGETKTNTLLNWIGVACILGLIAWFIIYRIKRVSRKKKSADFVNGESVRN